MIITSIEKQNKNSDRYNIFVDFNYCFSADYEDIIALGIIQDKEIDDCNLQEYIYKCQFNKAYNKALRLLSIKQRSEYDIRAKLKTQSYNQSIIDEVVIKLKELNYVNDNEFARLWVEDKQRFKPMGSKRLAKELSCMGVDKEIINKTISSSNCDDLKSAVDILNKKLKSITSDMKDYKWYNKLLRYLLYRGIQYDTAYKAIDMFLDENDIKMGDSNKEIW